MSECNNYVYPGRKFPVPTWLGTQAEQDRLIKACITNMGECTCHPATDMMGRPVEVHVCPAHEWLHLEADHQGRTVNCFRSERDGGPPHTCVRRSERLLWMWRMRGQLMASEGLMLHCAECGVLYLGPQHTCTPVRKEVSFDW